MELNNLQNESAKLRLTPAEKTAMKALLRTHYEGHARPLSSPYISYFSLRSFSGAGQFMHARVLAPMAVVLVVFVGAGTAAAAHGSLPGDILYPVKVSINEPVEMVLATTPTAKAQVQAKLAVRRVEEAEVLAAQGELTASTSAELATSFETHAQAAEDLAADVSAQDPDTGASLKADLGSSLAAHSAILATLGQESAASDDDAAGSESLATRVLARADVGRTVAMAKVMALSAPAAQTKLQAVFSVTMVADDASSTEQASTAQEPAPMDSAQERGVVRLKDKAQSALIGVRENFEDSKEDLDATTSAQVADRLAQIDQLMVEGAEALEAHEYVQARAKFVEALSSSIKLSTLLVAQEKIKRNIITPVLENHLIINTADDDSVVIDEHILPAAGL